MITASKLTNFLRACFTLAGLYIFYGFLMGVLHALFPGLDTASYQQESLTELLTEDPLRAFFMIVVVAPVLEEMMFRTLLKPSHVDLVLFTMIWPVFFLLRFLPFEVHWAVLLGFTAIFLFCLVYIVGQLIPPSRTEQIRQFLDHWRLPVWILTSLVFGFMHIGNYVDEFLINMPLFLIIVPRILAGLMIGWVKMKNEGLAWAVALHAMNNGLAFSVIYYTLQNS